MNRPNLVNAALIERPNLVSFGRHGPKQIRNAPLFFDGSAESGQAERLKSTDGDSNDPSRVADSPYPKAMVTRVVNNIPEWRFQAEVVARLHKMEADGLPLTCAGDMAAAKRTKAEQQAASATGLTRGETDLRVYLWGGRLLSIELKAKRGRLSAAQKLRHARLAALGFEVLNPRADTPDALADLVEAEVRARLGGGNMA